MIAVFQSFGILPLRIDELRRIVSGLLRISASSDISFGCISSGPEDLLVFRLLSFFSTSSTWISIIRIFDWDRVLKDGILSSGSLVNTLENWSWRRFAFSLSSNTSEFLSSKSASSGATPTFVFSFLRAWLQNNFGLYLLPFAIPCSNFCFSLRTRLFTLFLALAYSIHICVVLSSPEDFIHFRYSLFFTLMALRVTLLRGYWYLDFHDGVYRLYYLEEGIFLVPPWVYVRCFATLSLHQLKETGSWNVPPS